MSSISGSTPNKSFPQRRPDTPRKVRGGIKLTGKLPREPLTPEGDPGGVARNFLSLIEHSIAQAQLAAGWEYARIGQIVQIAFEGGAIRAQVQGTQFKPYETIIRLPSFDAEAWETIIESMAGEAVYVAKLLADELPPTLDALLQERGLRLLPASADQISFECTCASSSTSDDSLQPGGPCKHLAAIAYLAAEQLLERPTLIFSLLGLPVEQLLDRLRHARTLQSHGVASASADSSIFESQAPAVPLESCMHEFWRSPLRGSEWDEMESPLGAQHVPHALLRRLGPSPLNGRFPLVGLLASVYDAVAAAARNLRDEADNDAPRRE